MKKTALWFIGGGVILAAGAAGGVVVVAERLEDQYRRSVAQVEDTYILAAETVSYEKHLLGAEATTRIKLSQKYLDLIAASAPNDSQEVNAFKEALVAFHIDLRHKFDYVPTLDGEHKGLLITTTLVPTQELTEFLASIGGKDPLLGTTHVAFDGGSYSEVTAPAWSFEKDGRTLTWRGAHYTGTTRPGSPQVALLFKSDGLSVKGEGMAIDIGAISATGDMDLVSGLGIGDLAFAVENIAVAEVQAGNERQGSIGRLAYEVSSRQSGELIAGTGGVKVEDIVFDQARLPVIEMQMSYANLHAATMHRYRDVILELQPKLTQRSVSPEDFKREVLGILAAFLEHSPSFNFDRIHAQTPLGPIEVKWNLAYDHSPQVIEEAKASPVAYLKRLKSNADVRLSEQIVRAFLMNAARTKFLAVAQQQGTEMDPEDLDFLAAQEVENTLAHLQQTGLLGRDGDGYKFVLNYTGDKLQINGRDFSDKLVMLDALAQSAEQPQ